MIKWVCVLIFVICSNNILAQKASIDSSVFDNWPSVQAPLITNDGKYVSYLVNAMSNGYNIVVKSLENDWQREYSSNADYVQTVFISDSRHMVFPKDRDSVVIVELGKKEVYMNHIESYMLSPYDNRWMLFKTDTTKNVIGLYNIADKRLRLYRNIIGYHFNPGAAAIVIERDTIVGTEKMSSLYWIELETGNEHFIWRSKNFNAMVFSGSGNQLSFLSVQDSITKIVVYNFQNKKSSSWNPISSTGSLSEYKIIGIRRFTNDNQNLIVNLQRRKLLKSEPNGIDLTIWKYNDSKLASERKMDSGERFYAGYFSFRDSTLKKIDEVNDLLYSTESSLVNIYVVANTDGDCGRGEDSWNPACKRNWYLINLEKGTRKLIDEFLNLNRLNDYKVSPEGKYIVFFDEDSACYFSYSISTHAIINITGSIKAEWAMRYFTTKGRIGRRILRGIAGWHMGDKYVYVYDANDIWKLDPAGVESPVNITNGYGSKHDIVFSILSFKKHLQINGQNGFYLSAFNAINKENGFYFSRGKMGQDPTILTMGPFIYYLPFYSINGKSGLYPIKARNSERYLVSRESATASPNIYLTSDFINFKQISNICPERKVLWMTSELHTWYGTDGIRRQGILYKPENFDATRKYPLIINIYDKESDVVNGFIKPEPLCNGCNVNPPLFVSNGYMIFKPDVHYTIDSTGESALQSVLSAVQYLKGQRWLDTTRIGIQGCSFAGYETNYIVTHSNVFAAACTSSGAVDFISHSTDLREGIYPDLGLSQYRIKTFLWDDPSVLINNSPIFSVGKVTTPILIFHTTYDEGVHFKQAVEFFTMLRRLGKKVWMLEYGGAANHGVHGAQADDFSRRLMHFFDYYLKGLSKPQWMN